MSRPSELVTVMGGSANRQSDGTVWDTSWVKRCSKCERDKPLADFPPRKTSRDGLHGWCRPCYRVYYAAAQKRWSEANRERSRESQRRWRQENHEAALARDQRYREKRRDILRKRDRERRQANPAAARASYQRWRKSHREQELVRLATRHALVSSDPALRAFVADLRTQPCAYCGATENITIDHVVPLSRGGEHVAANLAPACARCNFSKGAKLLDEWLTASPSCRR